MRRPAPTLCALAAVLLLAAGCGGRSAKPVYELPPPAPPGEDKPQDEVSENLALALGSTPGDAASLEARRATLPKELVGDRQNAEYSGERLTGSVATRAPASAPTPAAQAIPVAPDAPDAAPRVTVERQPAAPAPAPATPKAPAAPPPETPTETPPAPAAPQAPVAAPAAAPVAPPAAPSAAVANAATAGQVVAQIAAFRTRANAEGGWQRLRAAHPEVLGDRPLILHEVDLGTRGIYYRVRTGPFADTAEAMAFCDRLRAQDQACVVISPN